MNLSKLYLMFASSDGEAVSHVTESSKKLGHLSFIDGVERRGESAKTESQKYSILHLLRILYKSLPFCAQVDPFLRIKF